MGLTALGDTEGDLAVTPTPVPLAEGVSVIVIADSAILRAAPSPIGVEIETLPQGTRLEIVGPLEVQGGISWWQVQAESGQVGYIAAEEIAVGD